MYSVQQEKKKMEMKAILMATITNNKNNEIIWDRGILL